MPHAAARELVSRSRALVLARLPRKMRRRDSRNLRRHRGKPEHDAIISTRWDPGSGLREHEQLARLPRRSPMPRPIPRASRASSPPWIRRRSRARRAGASCRSCAGQSSRRSRRRAGRSAVRRRVLGAARRVFACPVRSTSRRRPCRLLAARAAAVRRRLPRRASRPRLLLVPPHAGSIDARDRRARSATRLSRRHGSDGTAGPAMADLKPMATSERHRS